MLDHNLRVAAVEADLLDGGQLELGPFAVELEIVMIEQLDLGHLVAELVLVLLLLLQSVAFELVLAAYVLGSAYLSMVSGRPLNTPMIDAVGVMFYNFCEL
jgi:hypothetical protein